MKRILSTLVLAASLVLAVAVPSFAQRRLDGFSIFVPSNRPPTPDEGTVYQSQTDHKFYIYNGSAWVAVGTVTGGSCTSQYVTAISAAGVPTCSDVTVTSLASPLPVAQGGVGAATSSPYTLFGNFTGATAAPGFSAHPVLLASGLASGMTYEVPGTVSFENVSGATSSGSTTFVPSTEGTIKGGTLKTDGDRLLFEVSVTIGAATTNNKNLRCSLGHTAASFNSSNGTWTGGNAIIAESTASNTGSISWYVRAWVTRTSATAFSTHWLSLWEGADISQSAAFSVDTTTVTWASDVKFQCAVGNTTGSNTTIVTLNHVRLTFEPYR